VIKELGYGPREKVGKEGVERSYERMLHGMPGRRDIELRGQTTSAAADGQSRVIESVADEQIPQKGTDVYLTVDKELQAVAGRLLGERRGAVVVSCLADPHQGEILALASSPSYDPNRFTEPGYYLSLIQRADGAENKQRPLLNRSCRNAFPPGSTFKIVTATAALQDGVATTGSRFTCRGFLEIASTSSLLPQPRGHGLSFTQGIAESCDVVFTG
jgi:penicillin-binding protein 2